MAQGNNTGDPQQPDPVEFPTNFNVRRLEQLKTSEAERAEQIKQLLELAKKHDGYVYLGVAYEAKNAPFKIRAVVVRESEFA